MSGTVSIKGLNKADVLASLYNAARAQGMGFIHYDPMPMTREVAEQFLERTTYFDYLVGRVMKVKIEGEEINCRGFEMDNGTGTVAKIIETLRETGDVNAPAIQSIHVAGIAAAQAEMSQW